MIAVAKDDRVEVELRNPAGAVLGIERVLLSPAGGRLTINPDQPRFVSSHGVRLKAFRDGFEGPMSVKRWQTGTWSPPLLILEVVTEVMPVFQHLLDYVVMPPLDPGVYRLSRHHQEAGELSQVVWVTPDVPVSR